MKKENISVVAVVMTQWHCLGVISYLMNKDIKFNDLNIILLPHPVSGYLVDGSEFKCFNNVIIRKEIRDGSLFKILNGIILLFVKYNNPKNIIFFISPRRIALLKLLSFINSVNMSAGKIKYVCVDEGMGTYLSDKVWSLCSLSEGGYRIIDRIKYFLNNYLDKLMFPEKWNILYRVRKKLFVDYEVADSYKKAINIVYNKEISLLISENIISKGNSDKKALILTQPWSENGLIKKENEMELIKNTIKKLIYRGYNVYLKMHPREEMGKYSEIDKDINIINKNMPAEVYFCAFEKNDIVLGYNSTALLTAYGIFGIKAYTIIDDNIKKFPENMMSASLIEFKDNIGGFIDVYR
jgi:hypothetical protein